MAIRTQNTTSQAAMEAGLRTCSVFVEFDDAYDRFLAVVSSDIHTDDPSGFFQDPFGSDRAPDPFLCEFFPLVCSDSYVTMEGHCLHPELVGHDFEWDTCSFNCSVGTPGCEDNALCGQTAGGWFDGDPFSSCGPADSVPFLARIAQLTIHHGYGVEGGLTVIYRNGDVEEVAFDFECFVCPGDLDGDGVVSAADLAQLLGAWGPNPGHPADLDGDDNVGPPDLAIVLGNWGPCK